MNGKMLLAYLVRRACFLLGFLALGISFVVLPTQLTLAAPRQDDAMVRVVHASPDAGTVDVFVDGSALLTNFTFGTVSGYVSVPAGPHKIQVAPAGKGASAAVITQTVTVNANTIYTVAAIGTTASGFSLDAFVDSNTAANGEASVRVYHLSPDAGPVDVAAGGKTVISGLSYKNASSYLAVPAGSYTFTVTATDSGTQVPLNESLSGGMVYSVFAVGLLKGSPALTFKVAAVAGVPGMPNTGSDPNAIPVPAGDSQPWLPWLLGISALALLGAGLGVRRSVQTHQK
jgi:hypothetical protein